MSADAQPWARKLSLRDAKKLARALQSELSSFRPTSSEDCRALVARLPVPGAPAVVGATPAESPRNTLHRTPEVIVLGDDQAEAIDAAVSASMAGQSVTTTIHPAPDLPLIVEGGSPPAGSLSLGTVRKDKGWIADLFSRPSPALSWTPQGMLGHGLMFGCCGSGQDENIVTLAMAAAAQGYGVTMINAHGDISFQKKVLSLAAVCDQTIQSRLRVLDFMRGAPPDPVHFTHTFNPFASGPAPSLAELLTDALSVPGLLDELPFPQKSLLMPLLTAVLFPLVWGRDRGLWPLDLAIVAKSLGLSELQKLRMHPHLPAQLQAVVDYFFQKLSEQCPGQSEQDAYAPLEQVLSKDILAPLAEEYAHVFAAIKEPSRWQAPQVSPRAMLDDRLITILTPPALEGALLRAQVAARLVTSSLSAHVVSRAQKQSSPRPGLCHLVVAQHAYVSVSGRAANQLVSFGHRAGVGCLLTAADYPQLKLVPGLDEVASHCNTKFFMKQCEEPAAASNAATGLVGSSIAPSSSDMRDMREGQAHIIAHSQLWKVDMAFTDAPRVKFLPMTTDARWLPLRADAAGFEPGQARPSRMSQVLCERLAKSPSQLSLSWCQETVARMLGYAHWHELCAATAPS